MEFKQIGAIEWKQIEPENKNSNGGGRWFITTKRGKQIDVLSPHLKRFPEPDSQNPLWYYRNVIPMKAGKNPPQLTWMPAVYPPPEQPIQKTYYFDWFKLEWMQMTGFHDSVFYDFMLQLQDLELDRLHEQIKDIQDHGIWDQSITCKWRKT